MIKPFAPGQRHAESLAFQVGSSDQASQVSITLHILTQQDQGERPLRFIGVFNFEVHSDQRLDAHGHRLAVELHQGKEVPLIGQCHRWLTLTFAAFH